MAERTKCTQARQEIARLKVMSLQQLQRAHHQILGTETAITSAQHLRRKLAWQLQAREWGGLPESVRQRAFSIAREAGLRARIVETIAKPPKPIPAERATSTVLPGSRDSRLPLPGSLLFKDFKGKTHIVKTLEDGFEYEDQRYASLSSIAREISGTKWNGFAFFGLNKEK